MDDSGFPDAEYWTVNWIAFDALDPAMSLVW